jgi:hypothetical protein
MGKENEGQQPPAPGGTENSAGAAQPPNAGAEVQFTPEQQAKVDAIVTERLRRGREKWEADATEASRKAQEAAEATRLAEQQKWQELAEKREGQLRELEGKVKAAGEREGRLTRLEGVLKAHLDTQRAGLPPHVLALLDKLPVEEQLEYIAANTAALRPGQAAQVPPTPQSSAPATQTEEQRREQAVSIHSYW